MTCACIEQHCVFQPAFMLLPLSSAPAACRSLENTSSSIRWSLDLRWQHPDLPDGAYGLKRAIRMTAADDPSYVIPWEGWADVDKKTGAAAGQQQQQQQPAGPAGDAGRAADDNATAAGVAVSDAESPLSTILVGPWLDLWPITHENKYTRAWKAMKHSSMVVP
jgi:hypothetical protein